jgi:hypothetical protein
VSPCARRNTGAVGERTLPHWPAEVLGSLAELVAHLAFHLISRLGWERGEREDLEVLARDLERPPGLLAPDVELEYDSAEVTELIARAVLRARARDAHQAWCGSRTTGSVRTMLLLMASAQFVLMSGTIPSRCAMNSSESTDVFAKI